MIIVGAGLAGLLAARALKHLAPVVLEHQETLPNNHSALLRFRSDAVSEMTGIPFKEVKVQKGILDDVHDVFSHATLRDANAYSFKVTGKVLPRSILDLNEGTRFIAPVDLIEQLAEGAIIHYLQNFRADKTVTVSTIPMPHLMELLDYPHRHRVEFGYRSIWNLNCTVKDVEAYQTVYLPYGEAGPYRITITGNQLTMEYAKAPGDNPCMETDYFIEKIFGVSLPFRDVLCKEQKFGKILPISEQVRRDFIIWATDEFGIYSLGRYATWRNVLLDDVVNDIKMIQRFVAARSDHYARRKHLVKENDK